ncbi:MAG: hypothetical protein J7L54_06550 [Elusimicrobia bacterium]|nr:hypothetical protein [Elusimicrobiota bacterium]
MTLKILLLTAFGGAFVTYFLGKVSSKLRNYFAVFVSLTLFVAVACLYGKSAENFSYFKFFGNTLVLRVNSLSWFFAAAVSAFGALSVIFSLDYMKGKENLDFYYMMMLLVNAAMLGIVFAADLVSFFVFWEIMSWSTFLLISYSGKNALPAGIKYIVMSLIGSMAMFFGILSIYVNFHTLIISEIARGIVSASSGYKIFILVLFGVTFGIKSAVMPLHTWLPDAYTESPTPFSAVLSGMLTRMGVYGFLLFFYVVAGASFFFDIDAGISKFNYILCWLGAITIVIPTFIAMLQNDAKKLLAWHGIGQGGYMILGIAFGTSLGLAGGILHTLNYSICIVLLFMSVGAVEYRCGGVRDLNSLGGLIKKMPVAFAGALLGISGLIGLPLTNSFVSKWLIYKTLILKSHPFLAFAALIGTWGTILSVYKFLHNNFLGELPEKYENIRKSPVSMQIPIIILSSAILLFGILPGIPLKVINTIITSFGFNSLNVNLWGIASETGTLNTINIFTAILIAGSVIWMLFRVGKKSFPVTQDDNYAAGAYVPAGKYNYTADFYAPLFKIVKPYLMDFADKFFGWLCRVFTGFSEGVRKIYAGDVGYYVLYILFFAALLFFVQSGGKSW